MLPPLDNETIVPNLVLSLPQKKKKKCCSLPTRARRIRVLRFCGAWNTFFFQLLLLLLFWQSQPYKHASQSSDGNPEKKKNATAKVLMKSKPLMWSVKLRMIWRILPFKRRWYNESTLNRKQLKGQIGLINLKVIPLPQMVCNIQIIIIKNLEQICSLFGLS